MAFIVSIGVAGNHGVHVGQTADGKQIFQRLVRGSVGTDGNAAVSAGDQHVEVAVTDRDAQLIEVAGRRESRVGANDRQLAFLGQSDGNRGRRLLGNAHAQPAAGPLRVPFVELADGDRARRYPAPGRPRADRRLRAKKPCRSLCASAPSRSSCCRPCSTSNRVRSAASWLRARHRSAADSAACAQTSPRPGPGFPPPEFAALRPTPCDSAPFRASRRRSP